MATDFSSQLSRAGSGDNELSPELLLEAYRHGIFPMADVFEAEEKAEDRAGEISWYCPNPRAIVPLDAFHVPRSLARVVRQRPFVIKSDTAFEQVIRACAEPRKREHESWIDERIIRAYTALHEQGHAHSVEAWKNDALVGGLYGVHIGGAFCGESMFSKPALGGTNASKVCLVHLVNHLRTRGFVLLDTQFWNEHMDQFNCVEIPRREYLNQLVVARDMQIAWGDFGT